MRTDDDSWDITESVGATAIGVAAMRATETRRPDALFQDPYAEKLVDAVGSGWSRLVRGEVDVNSVRAGAYGPMGGFMTARTVYFDEYFTAAATAGIGQFAILASGLDARAYRLEWSAGAVIFEVDQPKVLEFKDRVLAADTPRADRRAVAEDLRNDWPQALRDNGFDSTRPTAWLTEGLLRYLPPEAQDRLFEDIAELSAPGSRIALNIGMGTRTRTAEEREIRQKVLAKAGITMDIDGLWYPSEGRTDPRDWFADHGWKVSQADPIALLADRGREVPESVHEDLRRHILMTAVRP